MSGNESRSMNINRIILITNKISANIVRKAADVEQTDVQFQIPKPLLNQRGVVKPINVKRAPTLVRAVAVAIVNALSFILDAQ